MVAPRWNTSNRQPGFSLIEVVIALGIMGFALVSILGLMTVGLHSSKTSREYTLLSAMAQEVIADVRSQPYDTLATQTYTFDEEGNLTTGTDAVYECKTQFAPVNPNQPGLTRVSLQFSWPIQAAKRQTYTLNASVTPF